MTTDAYYGDDFMQGTHSAFAYGVIALVVLHITGVIVASHRHKENLVTAMLTGNKRAAAPEDLA